MICKFCQEETYIDDDGFNHCDPCNTRHLENKDGIETIRVYFFKEPSIFYSIVMTFGHEVSYTALWYRDRLSNNSALYIPKGFPNTHPNDIEALALRMHNLRAFI